MRSTVRLRRGVSGSPVAATVSYLPGTQQIIVDPDSDLHAFEIHELEHLNGAAFCRRNADRQSIHKHLHHGHADWPG